MKTQYFFVYLFFLLTFPAWMPTAAGQEVVANSERDSIKLRYPVRDRPFSNLYPRQQGIGLGDPANISREIVFDPETQQYIIRERLGERLYRPPHYLTIGEFGRYQDSLLKRDYWRTLSDRQMQAARSDRFIPTIYIQSEAFERLFGGNTIDIIPRGSADISIMGQHHRNDNPMFNERQRRQWGFDFDQRIQMNVTGQIGDRLRLTTNYNTEAHFDFENQIRLDYVGKDDDIVQRVELGNVNLPLNTTLINGTQSLFGLKTQLQFGRLNVTGIFSQQRSQQREIVIRNGAQESEFELRADDYEDNQHYFLSQYFRDNFNRALALAPIISTDINITQIEVWVSNRNNSYEDARDVLALMDLGEQNPYNPIITRGASALPSTGLPGEPNGLQSNNLLDLLGTDARLTSSNFVQTLFQSSGGNDNYAKLTYARKLREGSEYTVNRRLGFISLNMPLNGDQVLAVAYRYTANGREYQVGEFSTDIPVAPSQPQVLYAKLLKNEILKPSLPLWDLMMKNIYSIGAYGVGQHNFRFNIYRVEDESGVERPVMAEGQNTQNKLWIQLTGLDRLNPQQSQQPDGFFDFLPGLTIDPDRGRIMFPVVEPFGADLARQFIAGSEEELIHKYTYQALYDSTKVLAQQYFPNQNRYLIKGSYESEVGTEFQLGAINVPRGSVQVFAGPAPLQEGVDFMVDYDIGRLRIINEALLMSGQPIRIKMENNELFGLQQRTVMGTRLDYEVNNNLRLGGTLMNLTERPLTQKVNIGEEPISNTMWGLDLSYNSASRWLTRMVDKIPFIDTQEESSISFYGEFAQLRPGHPRALNFAGTKTGISYVDDFENSRSFIDLKGAYSWQISGTPQLFPEAQLHDDLQYGFNRARFAFYNIDPVFYRKISITPTNISAQELSQHRVREVMEQEVFPYREPTTGLPMFLSTLDLAFYPTLRGPYNFTTSGVNPDGTLSNPQSRWGGMFRRIDAPDFEAQNIEFIEIWMMDPFLTNPNSTGGDLYFNLGNISEDVLKDGRKAMENGMSPSGDLSQIDETNWGRVPRHQPVVQAFDNDPVARALQDIGLDGLSDGDERNFHQSFLNQMRGILTPEAFQALQDDPSGDNFRYFRSPDLEEERAGILKRYERFNGTEGNSQIPDRTLNDFGVETASSTLLPDGEDINRDNNMNEIEEYYQYRISLRPQDMVVGRNFITDMHTADVRLRNDRVEQVNWYQFRIPLSQFEGRVGDIQDFKSVRFMRMFMTNFADTAVVRMAQLQLVRGEWRRYNAENNTNKVIADPSMGNVTLDNSTLEVAAVNIEQNGNRPNIPYVVPPGIERQLDWGNMNTNVQLNEQALSLDVQNLRDGYGRAAYRTATNDFRAYGRIQMFIHAEGSFLNDGDFRAFLRVGTDDQNHYYQYDIPLKVTVGPTQDPEAIWPSENRMNIRIGLFQEAKEARDRAVLDGQPWPVHVPFTFFDGENRVTIVGQPDISKIRFYMLGVMNPLRGSEVSNSRDDGLDKSGLFWFNELRLTDFDDRGGWGAMARIDAKLADFANVAISGSKTTIGFGSIEQRIGERSRMDETYFDIVTNAELGKFFPSDYGVRIPLFFSYTNQRGTPEYNPLKPDIELNSALANLGRNQRDSLLRVTQEYSTRRSFNLTNVRKVRTDIEKPVRPWNIENFSATYAFSEFYRRDHLTESAIQRNYRGALDYTFANSRETYIEPLRNIFKKNYQALLRDFNFNLMPSLLHFRLDVHRIYNENTLRENSPDNYLPQMGTLYNKNFMMNRIYGISWNLTKSLKLDFNATNYAIIDEPYGRLDGLQRDTLWENFFRLGRTTDYNHMMNLTYAVPIDKIPGLDWLRTDARYGTQFNWQTEPMLSMMNPDISLGNNIQNSRTIQLNPQANLVGLYNKIGFFRDNTRPDSGGGLAFLARLLSSVKTLNTSYTRVDNTFLPGYLPKTNLMGYDFDHNAPGWGFLFGSQRDIRARAAANNWITTDTMQTQLYMTSHTEDISIQANLEPTPGLMIQLSANRIDNKNYTANFHYSTAIDGFESATPTTTGNYSISYFTLGTAFRNHQALFRQFEENRRTISSRLGRLNPNSNGQTGGYSDGYDRTAQDVVVNAFLASYRGKDARTFKMGSFPRIPIPNWRISYSGLSNLAIFEDFITSLTLTHGYNNRYTINSYNSLIRYAETNGAPSERDINDNFLPEFQFQQVSIFEQFAPLLGIDARFKNSLTANAEFRRARTLNLSLQNSQLAMLSDQSFVLGMGYRATGFRMPFGWFSGRRMNNDLNFRLDVSLNDLKTIVYRSDINESEVSAGNRSISYRPSVDYVINQRFNIRLFFDSNSVRPYTSQTFATAYMNFGFNLRVMLQ